MLDVIKMFFGQMMLTGRFCKVSRASSDAEGSISHLPEEVNILL